MTWQPIETAPKDEWILVFMEDEDDYMGRIHAGRHNKVANGHLWVIGHHFASDLSKPTHWMPLPEPPEGLPA
jgi:hypothetical protein